MGKGPGGLGIMEREEGRSCLKGPWGDPRWHPDGVALLAQYTHPRRPSIAAAPPGMILVMKIPGSSGMWGLSIPPAMLKPRPELPCRKSNTTSFPRRQPLAAGSPEAVSPQPWLPGVQEPLQHLSRPRVPGSGGRGMHGRRGGWRSSAEALGAAAQSTEQMEQESGSRRGPPSPPRLH